MFVLGQHITRLNNLQFTSYERAMYRRRAIQKWLPLLSYSGILPAMSGWLKSKKHMYVTLCSCACHLGFVLDPPIIAVVCDREAIDTYVLSKEGLRVKAAAAHAHQLTLSPNRYVPQPRGGPPGSPVRLKAAAAVSQSVEPQAIARRSEKRRQALEFLMENDANTPQGTHFAPFSNCRCCSFTCHQKLIPVVVRWLQHSLRC